MGTDVNVAGYALHEVRRSDVAGDRAGGGIAIYTKQFEGLVFHHHKPEIDDANLAFVNNERFWVTLNSQSYKTAVCVLYTGCQYSDDRHGPWNDAMYLVIQRETAALRATGHRILYLGDFNSHLGCSPDHGIVGNKPDVNRNGFRMIDFLKNTDSVHINGACRTPGQLDTRIAQGLWTRQRGGVSSIIDYAGILREHLGSVLSLDIDDQGCFPTGSDHSWIFLDLTDRFVKKKRNTRMQQRKPS